MMRHKCTPIPSERQDSEFRKYPQTVALGRFSDASDASDENLKLFQLDFLIAVRAKLTVVKIRGLKITLCLGCFGNYLGLILMCCFLQV